MKLSKYFEFYSQAAINSAKSKGAEKILFIYENCGGESINSIGNCSISSHLRTVSSDIGIAQETITEYRKNKVLSSTSKYEGNKKVIYSKYEYIEGWDEPKDRVMEKFLAKF